MNVEERIEKETADLRLGMVEVFFICPCIPDVEVVPVSFCPLCGGERRIKRLVPLGEFSRHLIVEYLLRPALNFNGLLLDEAGRVDFGEPPAAVSLDGKPSGDNYLSLRWACDDERVRWYSLRHEAGFERTFSSLTRSFTYVRRRDGLDPDELRFTVTALDEHKVALCTSRVLEISFEQLVKH